MLHAIVIVVALALNGILVFLFKRERPDIYLAAWPTRARESSAMRLTGFGSLRGASLLPPLSILLSSSQAAS